jgi:sucrose-6F-phosphate phosphohydrolase
MNVFNPQKEISPKILATDLDGTLIPLPGEPENLSSLRDLSRAREQTRIGLIYATGRHFESVLEAIEKYQLPTPDWILSDVGTTIYQRRGNSYHAFKPYEEHMHDMAGRTGRETIEALLKSVDGLELQAPDHQRRFKISYQCAPEKVESLVATINSRLAEQGAAFDCLGSLDPFLNRGLLDVLPRKVTKAYALLWLSTHAGYTPDEVIYSGDSGNDLAALVSGFRAIVVANASEGLAANVRKELSTRDMENHLYEAKGRATTGVLEGCFHFGLIEE